MELMVLRKNQVLLHLILMKHSLKETAFNHCHFKYILADSSKFRETSAVTFGNIGEATILTDKKLAASKAAKHNNSIIISDIIERQ